MRSILFFLPFFLILHNLFFLLFRPDDVISVVTKYIVNFFQTCDPLTLELRDFLTKSKVKKEYEFYDELAGKNMEEKRLCPWKGRGSGEWHNELETLSHFCQSIFSHVCLLRIVNLLPYRYTDFLDLLF